MSEPLSPNVLQTLVQRFSTDEFYLWTVNRDPATDTYIFNFSYNENTRVTITATTEELRSYNKPEWAMRRVLQFARNTGRLMGGRPVEFRMSELVASMPSGQRPPQLLRRQGKFESTHGPTEAMLEATYRV